MLPDGQFVLNTGFYSLLESQDALAISVWVSPMCLESNDPECIKTDKLTLRFPEQNNKPVLPLNVQIMKKTYNGQSFD